MSQAEARTIADLTALNYVDRHIRARYAAVHRTDELQAGIYVLEPGGRVPSHRHSTSWDFAVVLDGEIEASHRRRRLGTRGALRRTCD